MVSTWYDMWLYIENPCPVLNTDNFAFAFGGKSGYEIPLNEQGLAFLYEFVALKGSYLKVERETKTPFIYEISSLDYPSSSKLFVDSRFGTFLHTPPKKEKKSLPSSDQILEKMKSLLGKPYVWGGNWSQGVAQLLHFYPPKEKLDLKTETLWTLSGIDCSGLLYEATEGATPRNTQELQNYGNRIPHFSPSFLRPLDMILYPKHVLFILDKNTIIESKYPNGVILQNLEKRLFEISNNQSPSFFFQVRRFL